jgi:hypothetical protein
VYGVNHQLLKGERWVESGMSYLPLSPEPLSFKVSLASRYTSITIPLGCSRFPEEGLSRLLYTNYSCLMATDEIDLRLGF